MNVVTAFLNENVFKEIYIHFSQEYLHLKKVLRFLKTFYDLKQFPRL